MYNIALPCAPSNFSGYKIYPLYETQLWSRGDVTCGALAPVNLDEAHPAAEQLSASPDIKYIRRTYMTMDVQCAGDLTLMIKSCFR